MAYLASTVSYILLKSGCLLRIALSLCSCSYFLLTEFEVRTINFEPSFSAWIHGPSAKHAGHKSERKNRGSVTYSTDRENEVSEIFIYLWVQSDGEDFNQAERPLIIDARQILNVVPTKRDLSRQNFRSHFTLIFFVLKFSARDILHSD